MNGADHAGFWRVPIMGARLRFLTKSLDNQVCQAAYAQRLIAEILRVATGSMFEGNCESSQ